MSGLPERLVTACARVIPVTGVGIMLMTEAGPAGMIASSDVPAAKMEELQFTLGEGPCVESSRTGRPVLQPDLALTGPARWPAFAAGALNAGILAIFALPLQIGGIRLGVLDLYNDRSGPLSASQLTEALFFADAATTILLQLQAQAAPDRSDIGSIVVLEDRAEVHQATGVVAIHANVPLTEALALLRARAFVTERPIIALARDVLSGAVRFGDDGHSQESWSD